MKQAKLNKIYRQLLAIVSLILITSLILLQSGNQVGIYVISFISIAMLIFSAIGYCPMLFFLNQMPWNKD